MVETKVSISVGFNSRLLMLKKYGVRTGMTAAQQAEAVTQYLRDNGVRPGDPLYVIYQAIQAPAYVDKARATWS